MTWVCGGWGWGRGGGVLLCKQIVSIQETVCFLPVLCSCVHCVQIKSSGMVHLAFVQCAYVVLHSNKCNEKTSSLAVTRPFVQCTVESVVHLVNTPANQGEEVAQ